MCTGQLISQQQPCHGKAQDGNPIQGILFFQKEKPGDSRRQKPGQQKASGSGGLMKQGQQQIGDWDHHQKDQTDFHIGKKRSGKEYHQKRQDQQSHKHDHIAPQ